MSLRAFARSLGVDESAVRRAIRSGRITEDCIEYVKHGSRTVPRIKDPEQAAMGWAVFTRRNRLADTKRVRERYFVASVKKEERKNYVPRKQVEEFRYNLLMKLASQPETVQADFHEIIDQIDLLLG